jgi:hypothetical protein
LVLVGDNGVTVGAQSPGIESIVRYPARFGA